MVTESEAMEEKGNSSGSAVNVGYNLHGFYEFVSQNKQKNQGPSVSDRAHLSIWNMGHLFSSLQ